MFSIYNDFATSKVKTKIHTGHKFGEIEKVGQFYLDIENDPNTHKWPNKEWIKQTWHENTKDFEVNIVQHVYIHIEFKVIIENIIFDPVVVYISMLDQISKKWTMGQTDKQAKQKLNEIISSCPKPLNAMISFTVITLS